MPSLGASDKFKRSITLAIPTAKPPGAYHTGVELGGYEYSFSDAGVYKCQPRSAPLPAKFKQALLLGEHTGSANDVSRVVRELRDQFAPGTYDLLEKNCNVFSQAFSMRLIGADIPKWVNRLANTGGFFAKIGVNVRAAIEPGAPGSSAGAASSSAISGAEPKSSKAKKEITGAQKALLAKMKPKDAQADKPQARGIPVQADT